MPRVQIDEETPLVARDSFKTWCFAKHELWGIITIVCGISLFIFSLAYSTALCKKNEAIKTCTSSASFNLGLSGMGVGWVLCLLGYCCRVDLSSISRGQGRFEFVHGGGYGR